MRTLIAFAAAAFLVTGCASTPTHYAAAADVPMYTPAEWTAMNTDQSVPEIPEDAVATNDATIASTSGFSGYYGGGFRGFRNYNAPAGRSFTPSYGRSSISVSSTHGATGVSAGHSSGHSGGGHGGR